MTHQMTGADMATRYDPQSIESDIYQAWEQAGAFTAHRVEGKKPFTIVMPPPNITGQLHMGHAMDCVLQDAPIRYHRMKGDPTLWLPGTDHAAIATEIKVTEALKEQGIDKAEIGKIIPVNVGLCGDAELVLEALTSRIGKGNHTAWKESFTACRELEKKTVIDPELHPSGKELRMGEVVDAVTSYCGGKAIVVTDVGQNQLMAARYSRLESPRSFISSGGLGTMGFGIPAAIGAAIADPSRPVCLFVGDGGIQMTIQEFGTIMQEHTGVKIILLNNNWLGNVRQWQELFYGGRYSATRMLNPCYEDIAHAYGIKYISVRDRESLPGALDSLFSDGSPCLMDVLVEEEANVMPMVPPGSGIDRMMLTETRWYEKQD